jgi:excinuclease UvrABC nuclease subunit
VYRWNNLITGEVYVGSAVDLTKRLWSYFLYHKKKKNYEETGVEYVIHY